MKPHFFLALLAAALVTLVLPLTASSFPRPEAGPPPPLSIAGAEDDDDDDDADDEDIANDELEQEGTLALGEGSVQVTGVDGVATCAVPAGIDLSAFAGQSVEVKCELVNGIWTVTRVKSEDGKTEIRLDDEDHSGHGHGGTLDDDSDDDNSGPGNADDDSADDTDDDDHDHSGPGGGGGDDDEEGEDD